MFVHLRMREKKMNLVQVTKLEQIDAHQIEFASESFSLSGILRAARNVIGCPSKNTFLGLSSFE